MPADDTINEVEVFRTADPLAAQVAVDEVLKPAGIEGDIHDRTSHTFPAPAAVPGGYFVAVKQNDVREAIRALSEAQEAGLLGKEGEVLGI
jgi:hypothetical protein